MPRIFLISRYTIVGIHDDPICQLTHVQGKGEGRHAQIEKSEVAFAKFLRSNFGTGDYVVQKCRGGRVGFPLFWRGNIREDRFCRIGGSISPYLKSKRPVKAWHELKKEKKEE